MGVHGICDKGYREIKSHRTTCQVGKQGREYDKVGNEEYDALAEMTRKTVC